MRCRCSSVIFFFFFSSRRRHTRLVSDWSSDVCSSDLVDDGVLGPDDRVELLEGVIVSVAPQNVAHAAGVVRANHCLTIAVGERAHVRPQLSFIAGKYSVRSEEHTSELQSLTNLVCRLL